MGTIKPEVTTEHLALFPDEAKLLKPFLHGFNVTWARRRNAHNTKLSMYFLKPEETIRQLFGFEHEIALFVSSYPTLEARTMQAVDKLIVEDPAHGRVDQSIFFLVTESPQGREWVSEYVAKNSQARLPVVFAASEVRGAATDEWFARNVIRAQLFSRDLFDYQLPLNNDLFFFGRDQAVADQLDAIRRSQNRGLFGLRKTGKTSLLYKVRRLVEREDIGAFIYYDCKLPALRMLRWDQLLNRVIKDIASAYKISKPPTEGTAIDVSDRLFQVLNAVPARKATTLVFDEIEYISPISVTDKHWHEEFVPFWQILWSAQSQIGRLSTTIAGVNPSVVEMDTIGGVQNPMFGIVQSRYLQGLAFNEMEAMVNFFGTRMGMTFSSDALAFLADQYGGHPLLTRMACSFTNASLDRAQRVRPTEVTREDLERDREARDSELTFYCRHVVSELQRFYPDEYEMLEMLASKQTADVMDLMPSAELTRHLKGYGMIKEMASGKPSFAIPVVGRYVAIELARREGRQLFSRIVAEPDREDWVKRRTSAITRELRDLGKMTVTSGTPKIYGRSGFPEAEKFCGLGAVKTEADFESFINTCNRCLVESIDQIGKSLQDEKYFWRVIKPAYPDLWDALHRIRLYRNNQLHLELKPAVETELKKQLDVDLDGKRLNQVADGWFVLQQCVLDGLFLGAQCEINLLS